MHVEAQDGTVILKKLGKTFAVRDAERMGELLQTLAPFSQLVLDFTRVHECQDAAFLVLLKTLQPLVGVAVVLRGLTRHEARLLRYVGLRATEIRARA
jgi:hypothetical protein